MRFLARISGLVFLFVLSCDLAAAQATAKSGPNAETYTLNLRVDEVVLTFHAMDAQGLPVNDLKKDEIRLWDNGVPPRRIVAFDSAFDRPLRIGFLIDTSGSMQFALAGDKAIAERFAERAFRQSSDQAFVMEFGYASDLSRDWTHSAQALSQGIGNVREGRMNPLPGTALIDTIFRTCLYQFGKLDPIATGNMILLFSDGEDTASRTSTDEALKACQTSNTAIYAFRVPLPPGESSSGPKTLSELAAKTGGRVFSLNGGEDAIGSDLKVIESEMRNQYRLVYNPANLKHDGAFHRIEIQPPDRVERVEVRSGYYAPGR